MRFLLICLVFVGVVKCTNHFALQHRRWAEGGYVMPTSAQPGQTLSFYLGHWSSSSPPPLVEIVYEHTDKVVAKNVKVAWYHDPSNTVLDCGIWSGCDWGYPGLNFTIPNEWESGIYFLRYNGKERQGIRVFFVVACKEASLKSLLVPLNFFTGGIMYNIYGGSSAYGNIDSRGYYTGLIGLGDFAHNISRSRPVLIPSRPYAMQTVMTSYTDNPFESGGSFQVYPALPSKKCYVTITDLANETRFGLNYAKKFKRMSIMGKHEYMSHNSMNLLKRWVKETKDSRLLIGSCEFGWMVLEEKAVDRYLSPQIPTPPMQKILAYSVYDIEGALKQDSTIYPGWLGMRTWWGRSRTGFLQRVEGGDKIVKGIPQRYSTGDINYENVLYLYKDPHTQKWCLNATEIPCSDFDAVMIDPRPLPHVGPEFYSYAQLNNPQLRTAIGRIRFGLGQILVTPFAFGVPQEILNWLYSDYFQYFSSRVFQIY